MVGDVSVGTRISTSSGADYVSSDNVQLHENPCALHEYDRKNKRPGRTMTPRSVIA
jgi:hypothetical protein